jgi:hypothetical protein
MEYKKELQDIITEKFLNDKIDFKKYLKLTENIELITEASAKEIAIKVGIAAVGGIAIAKLMYQIRHLKRKSDEQYKKCSDACNQTYSKLGEQRSLWIKCRKKCEEEYKNRLEKIKEKEFQAKKKQSNSKKK